MRPRRAGDRDADRSARRAAPFGDRFEPEIDRPPRVHERPHVAHGDGEIGEADPPDDPHERGDDVAERILRAEPPAPDEGDECSGRYGTHHRDHDRMREPMRAGKAEEIEARIRDRARAAAQHQREHHE